MELSNELRWINRTIPAPEHGPDGGKDILVLQQKWVTYWSNDMGGEPREWQWVDVPMAEIDNCVR